MIFRISLVCITFLIGCTSWNNPFSPSDKQKINVVPSKASIEIIEPSSVWFDSTGIGISLKKLFVRGIVKDNFDSISSVLINNKVANVAKDTFETTVDFGDTTHSICVKVNSTLAKYDSVYNKICFVRKNYMKLPFLPFDRCNAVIKKYDYVYYFTGNGIYKTYCQSIIDSIKRGNSVLSQNEVTAFKGNNNQVIVVEKSDPDGRNGLGTFKFYDFSNGQLILLHSINNLEGIKDVAIVDLNNFYISGAHELIHFRNGVDTILVRNDDIGRLSIYQNDSILFYCNWCLFNIHEDKIDIVQAFWGYDYLHLTGINGNDLFLQNPNGTLKYNIASRDSTFMTDQYYSNVIKSEQGNIWYLYGQQNAGAKLYSAISNEERLLPIQHNDAFIDESDRQIVIYTRESLFYHDANTLVGYGYIVTDSTSSEYDYVLSY